MNFKKILISGTLVLFLAVVFYFYRQDKVLVSAISDSGSVKAEIFQTNAGLFSKKYCLRVTTIKTSVTVVNDEPRMMGMTSDEVRRTKLHWQMDTMLTIETPNGIILMNSFHDVVPPSK